MKQIGVHFVREGGAMASPARPPSGSSPQLRRLRLYAFPESHAASFALLANRKRVSEGALPAAFYTALLNNQPMGSITGDARKTHSAGAFASIRSTVQQSRLAVPRRGGRAFRPGLMYLNGLQKGVGQPWRHSTRAAKAGPHD